MLKCFVTTCERHAGVKNLQYTVESRPLAGEINIFEGEEKVTNLFFSGFGVLTSVVIVIMQMTLK